MCVELPPQRNGDFSDAPPKRNCTYSEAHFSDERRFPEPRFRFSLYRRWSESGKRICFCLFNPSTADEVENDPTIAKCIHFARRDGYGAVEIVNLFSGISTDPGKMAKESSSFTKQNFDAIKKAALAADAIVVAWGEPGRRLPRKREVSKIFLDSDKPLYCLRVKDEDRLRPRHPGRLPRHTKLVRFRLTKKKFE